MWQYQWLEYSGTIAGRPVTSFDWGQPVVADLELEAAFNAGSIYQLVMSTETYSDISPRSPEISLQISGLVPAAVIPEPTSISVVGLGILMWAVRRRK